MFPVPQSILWFWLSGIWSFGLIGGGIYLLHEWYERSWVFDRLRDRYVFHPVIGWNGETAMLAAGALLLFWSLFGGFIVRALIRAFSRSDPSDRTKGTAFPEPEGMVRQIQRADGTRILVEIYGAENNPPVLLTHSCGTNRKEWEYLRRDLSGKGYRLITWDLPGLGNSQEPVDKGYRLENVAKDLDLILRETCGDRPAVLAGHSLGGMITLTFCRVFPQALGTRVDGLLLIDTTYVNPVRTAKGAPIYATLEKPVLVPLLYLTILLSPLMRLSNLMGYVNGTQHLFSLLSGFAGTQSWEELDFATRFNLQSPPAVIAREMLGMLRYDARAILEAIPVPTLVIVGDRDSSCPPEASEFIARTIPRARLEYLSPGNHMALVEHHQTFADKADAFLTACFADPMARHRWATRTAQPTVTEPTLMM